MKRNYKVAFIEWLISIMLPGYHPKLVKIRKMKGKEKENACDKSQS
jgi:hypothetical protein